MIGGVVAKQRAVDRGDARGRHQLRGVGSEIRLARTQLALSIDRVAHEVGISPSELSRMERGLADWASVVVLARASAVVGLDLVVRAYPGSKPLRDARHVLQLEKLHVRLHHELRWSLEVPLPNPGDLRAWDAMIRGDRWRYGVECELNPMDGQALLRRLNLKQRDGAVEGVILLMPDTRQARAFRREFGDALRAGFPVPAALALRRLAVGERPGDNALIVL